MMSEEGLFVPDDELVKAFKEALEKYMGVFQIETDPRDLKRSGKIVITMYGVPTMKITKTTVEITKKWYDD